MLFGQAFAEFFGFTGNLAVGSVLGYSAVLIPGLTQDQDNSTDPFTQGEFSVIGK